MSIAPLCVSVLPQFLRAETMITVSGLHKSFGPVKAVAGVSFDAKDGRITG